MKLIVIASILIVGSGCGKQVQTGSKSIRMHDQNIKGVFHALPYLRGERYCSDCHGVSLSGGSRLEPGCYTCHGKLWIDLNKDDARFPESHVVKMGSFFHASGLKSPRSDCDGCHGSLLEGAGTGGAPPCLLCHEKLWN